jgi:hypothetical protein
VTPYEVVEDAMFETETRKIFGLPVWFGVRASVKIHKAENSYLITSYGDPVAEVFPNHVIILAPEQSASQYSYAWRKIIHKLFNSRKCNVMRRLDPRTGVSVCKISRNIPFLSWCVVDNRGDVINTDWKDREEITDKEKIKEYSKKLRLFFKPFEVVARLGTHQEEVEKVLQNKAGEQLSKYTSQILIDKIETNEPVTFVELLKFTRNTSYWFRNSKPEVVLAKFKSFRETLRLTFVRSCTTLNYVAYVPEDKYVQYQSMVLQQTYGLREVPIHGEIKVRRSRTRTSPSTSSRKD